VSPNEGLLLICKPSGPTSHDVVAAVRRTTGLRRVGHAGTLDPLASGLLPLVLGRATRLVRFLPASPKCYEGCFKLGLSTSTDDVEGEVLERHDGPLPAPERVLEAAEAFVGVSLQRPPRVSARKVGGQRLYKLARRGVKVEAPPRQVEITRFELLPGPDPATWRFVAEVSSGTYVRSIVRDLGAALGCGGTLAELRRTAIGPLGLETALVPPSLDALDPAELQRALIPLDRMPLQLPSVRLDAAEATGGFLSGVAIPDGSAGSPESGFCRVLDPDGRLLGVGERGDGRIRPRVVLALPAGA
jgi:tRNA pseudouridine55 synthase